MRDKKVGGLEQQRLPRFFLLNQFNQVSSDTDKSFLEGLVWLDKVSYKGSLAV